MPAVKRSPHSYLWSSYDAEADVLLYQFQKAQPRHRQRDDCRRCYCALRKRRSGWPDRVARQQTMNARGIVTCSNCGRILYYTRDMEWPMENNFSSRKLNTDETQNF